MKYRYYSKDFDVFPNLPLCKVLFLFIIYHDEWFQICKVLVILNDHINFALIQTQIRICIWRGKSYYRSCLMRYQCHLTFFLDTDITKKAGAKAGDNGIFVTKSKEQSPRSNCIHRQGILKGEVSLYRWPPVWLVWISLFSYKNKNCQ